MFCDRVGSTAIVSQLDPEDLRGIIGTHHRCCMELIERNEAERELLLRRPSRAKAGYGHLALMSGEAGIGKCRSTAALLEAWPQSHLRLRYFCSCSARTVRFIQSSPPRR
jgi:hypothetical protein